MKLNTLSALNPSSNRQPDQSPEQFRLSNLYHLRDKTLYSLSIVFFASLLVFAVVFPGRLTACAQEDKVVAIVNGDDITATQLARRANVYGILQRVSSIPEYYQFLLATETGRNSLAKYQRFILERMIEEKLQLQKAKERGFQATEEQIDSTVQRIIDARDDVTDIGELKEALQEQGSSMEELREQLRQEIIRSKLKQEVVGTIEITMGEIREFYDNNPDYFRDKEGEVKLFDQIKSNIAEIVKENKANKAWSDWMKEVKKNADIERKFSQMED